MNNERLFKVKLKSLALSKEDVVPHLGHKLLFAETDESHLLLVLCYTCSPPVLDRFGEQNGMLLTVIDDAAAIAELRRHVTPTLICEADLMAAIQANGATLN